MASPAIAHIDQAQEIIHEVIDGVITKDLFRVDEPELGLFDLTDDLYGEGKPIILPYAPTGGVGPSFARAMANKRDSEEAKFVVTTNDMFSLISIDHKSYTLTKSNMGAYYDLVSSRAKHAVQAYKNLVAHAFYGNGGGSLGTISSNGGSTITMHLNTPMWVFFRNQTIVPGTGDGLSGTQGATRDILGAINRGTRVLTADDGAFSNAAGEFQAGNHVFIDGGFNAYIKGFDAWFPTTAPSSSSFFGCDRTIDDQLYGTIYAADASKDSNVFEYIQSFASEIAVAGGEVDCALVSKAGWQHMVKSLGSSVVYVRECGMTDDGDEAEWGYNAIQINGPTGPIKIMMSRNCPRARVVLLTKKHCHRGTAGGWMKPLTYGDDTNEWVRHSAENAMESRIGGYIQFYCDQPSSCGQGDISIYLPTT